MAVNCFVFRGKDGEIDRVLAPNGKESILFKSLNDQVKDKETALKLWAQTYTPAFTSWFGDWETLEQAKVIKPKLGKTGNKTAYGLVFDEDPERALFEFAIQYNSSIEEAIGVENQQGREIVQLATKLFPNAKLGDEFKSVISKVVDENGEPLVVYHITDKNFSEFDKSKIDRISEGSGKGFYFSPNKEELDSYGDIIHSVFLNIKNPFIGKHRYDRAKVDSKKNDGFIFTTPVDIEDVALPAGFTEIIAYQPNQIKSISNEGGFNPNENNIYKQGNTGTTAQSLVGKLQSEGKLGKRIIKGVYEAPIDPSGFNPADKQKRAYDAAQNINRQLGKEVVKTGISKNGDAVIMIDPAINDIVKDMDATDINTYKRFLMDNLYTNEKEPTTTTLINNAALLAKDLGRQDLVNMARLINKYLSKNSSLSTRMIDNIDEEAKAYYSRVTNRITFAKDTVGSGTLEGESEIVLHEHLHGLTFQPWYKQSINVPLTDDEKAFKSVVDGYYKYFSSLQGVDKSLYHFKNAEEFLMGALMNSAFKEHLTNISQNDKVKENPFISFMKHLLKGFLRLFGMKIDDVVVDQIDPSKFEQNMFDALSDYLNKIDKVSLFNGLKEEGRNYGLSFAIVADQDFEVERAKIKNQFTPELKEQVKKTIEKSLLSIKSFGSTIRGRLPESQEGFRAIFNQLKKLEDPAYNLDQVDFFFDFTSEIAALMNTAYNKITKLQTDQTITDPDIKLKEYENIVSATRNFDPIISDIQSVKIKMENSGNVDMKKAAATLNDMMVKRRDIEAVYSSGVFPLVTSKLVDILSPASKKAIEIATANLDKLNKSLEIATKNNVTARVKQLKAQIEKEQKSIDKEFTLNSDIVEDWLRGEMGDSNIYSAYMMAGVSSANPIVSSVSKYIRDNVGEIAPKVLNLQNDMQSQIEAYSKSTGRGINLINAFNSPLIQTHKEITGKDEKGNPLTKEVLSLLHQFNNNHIIELQSFKRKLTDLYAQKREIENSTNIDEDKLNDIIKSISQNRKDRQQFLKDYMEQKYKPEVHEAMDMLYEDLGGFTAWDYMGPLIAKIEDTSEAIDQEEDESRLADLYNQLEDHNFELSRLSSLYERSPGTTEYKVAEQLKKRSALMAKYSTFILTDKGKQTFERESAKMKLKLDRGQITPERYERWLEDNTVTELTPRYWEVKKKILDGINDVATRLGATTEKNEDLKKLYNNIEDIVKAFRDNQGIIDGSKMSNKELEDVKNLEEKIEDLKSHIENIFGLTKSERIELSNLYDQLTEINAREAMTLFHPDQDMLNQEHDRLSGRIHQIESKKKKLNPTLLKEYFKWIKELAELDETTETKYYWDELEEQTNKLRWAVDITKIPEKLFYAGTSYNKVGPDWYAVDSNGAREVDQSFVENMYREKEGDAKLAGSDWWRVNHISRIKFVANPNYDSSNNGSYTGEWKEIEEPTYAWRQTRPRKAIYVNENQPSIKYKKRTIKDPFINSNYREDVSGNVQPKVTGAKDDRFINQDYKRLAQSNNTADKATFNYLNFLTNTYLKSQEALPQPRRKGYELPSIRKSEIERIFSQPIAGSTKDTFQRLGQMLRIWNDDVKRNEQDKDILYGYNDDFTGIVPMKFLGDIDSADQSIDLAKSVLAFAIESYKRDQLIKSLPLINAIKDISNNPDYRPVKMKNGVVESIKRKFLPKGTELAKRSTISNTALQINEIIKSEIYGENVKDVPGIKLVNTSLRLGAKAMLGFNFVSSVQNYANAFTQSMMETESKISGNFSMKSFFKAQKIYYGHIDELMADMGKYGNKSYINQFFDYFGGINFKLFSKNDKNLAAGKLREFVSDLSLPNTITEHMLNYHMSISIALDYRVKVKVDGIETNIPIFEAFTMKDRKLQIKPNVEITEADRKEMIARLNSSSRRINGEYGDKILADKYVLGKMVLFMNRYVVPFVVKRYGARKFDIQDGVREEGYWRLLGKVLLKDIKSQWYLPPIISGWKYYTREEKNAVIRCTTEFGFTIMFYLMMNALGGSDDRKLKQNSWLANNAIYALKGIQQQNEAFMPIPGVGLDDLFRKIQNPFPILGKLKNMISLINDGSHTLYYEMGLPGVEKNDVFYSKKVGWHKPGDLKMMSDMEKLIGLPQRLMQYMYPDESVKNIDAMSRIK